VESLPQHDEACLALFWCKPKATTTPLAKTSPIIVAIIVTFNFFTTKMPPYQSQSHDALAVL
jgi:hypothetical protein